MTLTPTSFTEEPKYELAPNVYFRDLCPAVFRQLRLQVFGLEDDEYIEGLMGDSGGLRGMSTRAIVDQMVLSFSEGKGGGFFFWSIDRRFMVKTLEQSEWRTLNGFLPAYAEHMCARHGSMLPRFYGAYSITIQNHTKCFVVMESVFYNKVPDGKVHQSYDLKGSWIDRHAGISGAHGGTYKDMDMHKPLVCDPAYAQNALDELRHDSELLMRHNLMDYSLLLGVHNEAVATHGLPLRTRSVAPNAAVARQVDVPSYCMGLIDVLQEWNMGKRLERIAKIVFKGRWARDVRDGMSAIEPVAYRERFLASMRYQLGVREGQGMGASTVL